MFTAFRIIIAWFCVISLIAQSGCAHTPTPKPYLLDEVWEPRGTVGIVPAKFRPEADLSVPAKGWLAGAGRKSAVWAGKGFVGFFYGIGDSGGCGPDCVLILLAVSVTAGTVGGLSGGVVGAIQAEPSIKVDYDEEAIKTVIASMKMQESLCSRVAQVAQSRTLDHFVVVTDQGPTSPEEKNLYGSLAEKGIDTVLEIAIPRIALAGNWDVNPPLQFQMNSHIRLLRTTDGKELYDFSSEYKGISLTFSNWAGNDANPFFEELEKAYQFLAEKIVGKVFILSASTATTTKEIARDDCLIAYDNGTIMDTRTNLMWAAKDNGNNINWANAKSYCENYRGGGYMDWRMPTQNELAGLYDAAKYYMSDCVYYVHLTELIRLTCSWTWASETRGSEAAGFYFNNGLRSWNLQSYGYYSRVLPVRSAR